MTNDQFLDSKAWEYKYHNDIGGTRYFPFKSQRLLSTGILCLDSILGGGIPIGTICLVGMNISLLATLKDDELGILGKILLKNFFAAGYSCKHSLFVASQDIDSHSLITHLLPNNENLNISHDVPAAGKSKTSTSPGQHVSEANIREYNCDLTGNLISDNYDIRHWPSSSAAKSYMDLSLAISDFIAEKDYQHYENRADKRINLLRIGLHCIGSNAWSETQDSLPTFLYNLRAIVSNSFSVAMVTIPRVFMKDQYIVERCEQLSDSVVKFELLTNKNPLFSEYGGLIKLVKLSNINTLAAYSPEDSDWGIKIRRKNILIERLHLPPEFQSTVQREQDDIVSCHGEYSNPAGGVWLVAVGALFMSDSERVLLSRLIPVSFPDPLFFYISLAIIAYGFVLSAVSVLGCVAAKYDNYLIVSVYIFSLVVLLVAECVLTLFAIICPQYLGLAIDKDDLVTLWQRNYGVPGKEQMTVAIDLIQTKFECCGALSGTEYSISWWNLKELAAPNLLVPFSCCVQGENKSYLDPSPLNNTLCQEKEMDNYRLARHVEGCLRMLEVWLQEHVILAVSSGSGLILYQLLLLLIGILICVKKSHKM